MEYLCANPDLQEKFLSEKYDLYLHYLLSGHKEKRPTRNQYHTVLSSLPSSFDMNTYRFMNPDIKGLSCVTTHFMKHGYGEGRFWNIGMSYEILNKFLIEQEIFFDDDAIVMVNHHSSRTGAPFFLQDLANWLVDQGKKVVWLDIHPSDCFQLNPSIQKIYYFNNSNILKDILEANDPKLIYSNSTTRLVLDNAMFKNYLDRTIVHFHETYYDLYRCFNHDRAKLMRFIGQAKSTFFVADKILENFQLPKEIKKKCKVVPEFINPTRIENILKTSKRNIKNKRIKIGMCGTVCYRKNPRLFTSLAKANPKYDFIWIGGDFPHTEANLSCVPVTKDPYKQLEKLDYFMLTSSRDPCPVVVLESLLMNHKIILLEGNIRYEHPIEKLENVILIKDHKLNEKTIVQKFSSLELDNEFNKTNKNQDYIISNFSKPKIGDL